MKPTTRREAAALFIVAVGATIGAKAGSQTCGEKVEGGLLEDLSTPTPTPTPRPPGPTPTPELGRWSDTDNRYLVSLNDGRTYRCRLCGETVKNSHTISITNEGQQISTCWTTVMRALCETGLAVRTM